MDRSHDMQRLLAVRQQGRVSYRSLMGPACASSHLFLRRRHNDNYDHYNRTPAMMRIVVGSIEALSLKIMRHGFRYGLFTHITELGTTF